MRNLTGANAISVLLFGVAATTVYFLTLYLQQILGYSALLTGLAFLPNAVLVGISATVAGKMVGRLGVRILLAASLAVLAVGELLFIRIGTDSGYVAVILPGIVLNAVGLGGSFVAASVAATSGVADRDQGLATSLFTAAQQIGAAIGIAFLVVLAAGTTALPGDPSDVVTGYRWAFAGATAFAVLALAITVIVLRGREHNSPQTTPAETMPQAPCPPCPKTEPTGRVNAR